MSLGSIHATPMKALALLIIMIVSSNLFEYINDFNVIENDDSDHLPISCSLILPYKDATINTLDNVVSTRTHEHEKFRWSDVYKSNFVSQFNNLLRYKQGKIMSEIMTSIDCAVNTLTDIYKEAGSNMQLKYVRYKNSQPRWWDVNCDTYKREKYSALCKFRRSNLLRNLRLYKVKRNQFKSYCRSKQLNFQRDQRQKLINVRNNPKVTFTPIETDPM